MADYPYSLVPGKLREILSKIRSLGIPAKANLKWLESIGYKSKNDRTMITVLKFIRFIDTSGKPSELWLKYRGRDNEKVLAQGISEGYAELFATYPDAYKRGQNELENFFSTHTTAGKQVIGKTVSTFRTLCDLAKFDEEAIQPQEMEESQTIPSPAALPQSLPVVPQEPVTGTTPSIHIDVQIHISSDCSLEQIDHIFASMAKHLYRK